MSTATSQAQIDANRQNAQLSTGPSTPEGKAKSALNAVKTGLTGNTVLLPSEDAAAYQRHVQEFLKELKPVGTREHFLAQSLADNVWRIARIPALESAIFALGHTQFAKQFEHEDPAVRPGLIQVQTFMAYEKQLRNLQIQEARLQRQRAKDTAELRQLQQERIAKQKQQLQAAAELYTLAQQDSKPFDPAAFGFDFSISAIEDYLEGVRAANLAREHMKSHLRAA